VGGRLPRWLLIGNSRWHWAEAGDQGLHLWDRPPPLQGPVPEPIAWAAVGPLPPAFSLPGDRRVAIEAVPLIGMPPWLGIDRALAGWQAWCEVGGPVLVVDAGTVLSFTRVDGRGRFRGGRLQAGVALQLGAMAAGTVALPLVPADGELGPGGNGVEDAGTWPTATAEAMQVGVRRGLAAAIVQATREAAAEEPGVRMVITGGDGPLLCPLLRRELAAASIPWDHRPGLCLEALVRLRPAEGLPLIRRAPDPPGSDRPSPRP
jgi:type III pantothenate kinase